MEGRGLSAGSGPGFPPPDPWRELNRRRVVRAAVLYAAAAFAGLEAVALVLPALPAPPWAFRAVLGAVVLGFPPSMVLAWSFDVTPRGLVRTPDDAPDDEPVDPPHMWWLAGVLTAVVVGAVLAVFG